MPCGLASNPQAGVSPPLYPSLRQQWVAEEVVREAPQTPEQVVHRLELQVASSQELAVHHPSVSETLLRALCQQDQQHPQHMQVGGQECGLLEDPRMLAADRSMCFAVPPPLQAQAQTCRRCCWL